jgi:hypothetical protein
MNASGPSRNHESDDRRPFDPDVLGAELIQIYRRRISRGQENADSPVIAELTASQKTALPQAHAARCVGLALSGGGIRSATFNLGLLQGLARLGVLGSVDYLSTVSGGGYIGGWLAAWIQREGDAKAVERRLADADQSSAASSGLPRDPINHLRRYSNYLAPRQGFLSADRWVLWANYLRNFLLNQMVLLPLLIILLLCVRFFMWLYCPWSSDQNFSPDTRHAIKIMACVGVGSLVSSLVALFYAARMVASRAVFVESYDSSRWTEQRIVVPILGLVVFAFASCAFVPYDPTTIFVQMLPGWREALEGTLPIIGPPWAADALLVLGGHDCDKLLVLRFVAAAAALGWGSPGRVGPSGGSRSGTGGWAAPLRRLLVAAPILRVGRLGAGRVPACLGDGMVAHCRSAGDPADARRYHVDRRGHAQGTDPL